MSATLGGVWMLIWQKASAESLQINDLLREAQHLHTDIYRQAREAGIASRAPDSLSVTQYWTHVYDMDARFERLALNLSDDRENWAVAGMRQAYNMMQTQINVLLTEQNRTDAHRPDNESEPPLADRRRTDAHLLIDEAIERWINGAFSDAYSSLTRTVDLRAAKVAEQLEHWNRLAVWLFPLPLLAGALSVIYTHWRLNREFSRPMQALSHGALEIARGRLTHRILETGAAETRSLASSVNRMAGDLELAQAHILEQERQASLERLIPIVAHNIRNPLASIRALAQAADPQDSPEEQEETRQAIIVTVDRLERWTASLLSYLNPFKTHPVPVDTDSLVSDLLAITKTQAKNKNVDLIYRSGANQELLVDHNLLEQALHGLLINALEASPPHSRILISTSSDPQGTSICIDDQGPGMPFIPDVKREGPGPSTKTHGTGIGIPFALRVCQAHGGQLVYRPSPDGGTRVSFWLPDTNNP
ncbi:MAG: HAMP domain-containing histidine kinase [Gammaproteobacteria bacterium]|nr:HAMP domain-containing histidine kinase [Gammaproteobacteria bacterium]